MHKFRSARDLVNLRQGRNDWYRIKNLSGGLAEVMIYDEIGYFGITASDFVRELKDITADRLNVHLNTPGGEVFDGIAIYQALRQHPAQVHVTVDSLAASIGSVIAMAGDNVVMARNSTMMIHDGFGMGVGNAADMRELANLLDKTSENIASIYAERTGKESAYWRGLMKAETWFSAEEAVDAGLADSVQAARGKSPENTWDLSIFARYVPSDQADIPESDRAGVERHLRSHLDSADQLNSLETPAFSLSPDDFRLAVKEAIVSE